MIHPSEIKQPLPRRRVFGRRARFLVVTFFFVVLVAIYFGSPLSEVRSIEVHGAKQLVVNDIQVASGIQLGQSVWKVDKSQVQKQLLQTFPLMKQVDVRWSITGDVTLTVSEKSVTAVLIQQGVSYRLLNDGTVFDRIKDSLGSSLPIVRSDVNYGITLGKPISDTKVADLCSQLLQTDPKIMSQISDIFVTKDALWKAYSRDGFEIRFPAGQFAEKMKIYADFRKRFLFGRKPGIITIYDKTEAWYDPFPESTKKGE